MSLQGSVLDGLTNSMKVVKLLFEGEIRRLDCLMEELVQSNDRLLTVQPSAGFMFLGKFYKRSTAKVAPMHGERHMLHPTLLEPMQEYLQATSKFMMDAHKINQMCYRLVKNLSTSQDIRDALPECLIGLSDEAMQLPRTREAAFTIIGDERATRQYEAVLPLIEFYAATRLLF